MRSKRQYGQSYWNVCRMRRCCTSGTRSAMPLRKSRANIPIQVRFQHHHKCNRSGDVADRSHLDENWPGLLQALFNASQSPDAGQRENAFRIFTATPGIIEQQHASTVLGAFAKGFKDEDVSVRHSGHSLTSRMLTDQAGQTSGDGSIRIIFRFLPQKNTEELLLVDTRSPQRFTTLEGGRRLRKSHPSLDGLDRARRRGTYDVQTSLLQPCRV